MDITGIRQTTDDMSEEVTASVTAASNATFIGPGVTRTLQADFPTQDSIAATLKISGAGRDGGHHMRLFYEKASNDELLRKMEDFTL